MHDSCLSRRGNNNPKPCLQLDREQRRAMQRESWSRNLGYVEQMDIHSPQLTVYESLQARFLRLPERTQGAGGAL